MRTTRPQRLTAPAIGMLAAILALAALASSAHALSHRRLIAPVGAAAADQFGNSVAGAGDVNGDGFDDVIVAAKDNDAGGSGAGRAYVFFGGASPNSVIDLTLTGEVAGDHFGISVAGAGDVNGDGFDDLIVGANFNDAGGTDAGRAYVFFGGTSPNSVVDLTLTGEVGLDDFGYSVAGAGDVNGDGFDDGIVGARFNDAGGVNAGRAYVFFGGASPNSVADLTLTGELGADQLGFSVAGAGDVNGDGFDDLSVGAIGNDAGGTDAGRAYVFFGGASPNIVADLILTGEAIGDFFGRSVAGAGDVSGDGFDDLIVGALGNDAGGTTAGRAFVYDVFRYVLETPNGGETWPVGSTQRIAWLGDDLADVWLSTDGGLTYDRILDRVGGEPGNELQLLVPHAPTRFARLRLTPSTLSLIGRAESAALFTIETSVALLAFRVDPRAGGGAELSWSTEPAVGPQGIAGYRLYRIAPGSADPGTGLGPALITEPRYSDPEGAPGTTYRLSSVNGLGEELELGRALLGASGGGLSAWPSPLRGGQELWVSFAVPTGGAGMPVSDLDVGLFDAAGRRVATLARGQIAGDPGTALLRWSVSLAAGQYFVRASAPSTGWRHQTRVVVLP